MSSRVALVEELVAGDKRFSLSFSLTSARTRRASAAFSSAAERCSGVSAGGSGMASDLRGQRRSAVDA